MSLPVYDAFALIQQLIGSRMMLTFTVGSQTQPLCFFFSPKNTLVFDTVQNVWNNNPDGTNINYMVVYNPATLALESLNPNVNAPNHYYLVVGGGGPFGSLNYYLFLLSTVVSGQPPAQFTITNNQLTWKSQNQTTYYLFNQVSAGSYPALQFCTALSACSQQSNSVIKLLNATSLTQLLNKIGAIQDPATLCCDSDTNDIIALYMSLTVPLAQYNTNIFPDEVTCKAADTQCTCPTLRTCWMYNKTNVPCCVQGNPKDPQFKNDAAIIFQSSSACYNAARDCSQWRYNDDDVPCCVQRSMNEWAAAGYSPAVQSFESKSDCDNVTSKCTLQTLLQPPTDLKDYYGLVLENRYTQGCEQLRTRGPWGSSSPVASCSGDASLTDCYSGNCGVNYCSSWLSGSSPYVFNQTVRCLPPAAACASCPSGQQWTVCNQGQPNVTSGCYGASGCQ